MLKSWMRDITLALQARSGVTPGLFVWLAIIAIACLTAFAFLCVAGYDWLSLQLGDVFAGLVMAGIFVLIALIGAIVAGHVAPPRQGTRDPRTRRARAGVIVVAARPENSRRRNASRPHARLATHRTDRVCWLSWPRNGCASIASSGSDDAS